MTAGDIKMSLQREIFYSCPQNIFQAYKSEERGKRKVKKKRYLLRLAACQVDCDVAID